MIDAGIFEFYSRLGNKFWYEELTVLVTNVYKVIITGCANEYVNRATSWRPDINAWIDTC
uniref:Uncharacterized protein n=1 Tax=Pseudomonas syringae TaxID=317 RepID=I3W0G3_PSESX|nr:hypothetical protein [Pseudomonas syringae]